MGTKIKNWKEQGNKGNFGEQGTQKIKILILGNKGKCQIFSREQVPPPPLEDLSFYTDFLNAVKHFFFLIKAF